MSCYIAWLQVCCVVLCSSLYRNRYKRRTIDCTIDFQVSMSITAQPYITDDHINANSRSHTVPYQTVQYHIIGYKWKDIRTDHISNSTDHIMSHHITSHHITAYHITSHHITSHHMIHHITPHLCMSYHITSHQSLYRTEQGKEGGCDTFLQVIWLVSGHIEHRIRSEIRSCLPWLGVHVLVHCVRSSELEGRELDRGGGGDRVVRMVKMHWERTHHRPDWQILLYELLWMCVCTRVRDTIIW